MVHRKRVDSLLMSLFVNNVPDGFYALFIVELLEYTIAADHEEVKVGLQLENANFRIAHNNVRIATIFGSFGFDIAKCPRY